MSKFKFPKLPGKVVRPTYPKATGEGYRRPDDGNDTNLGQGQFEARIRPLTDLGSGIQPFNKDRPPPLWTQFLSPKEYNWVYSEVVTDITAGVLIQQVDSVTVPGTLALVILEWTPLLMRPKPGNPVLREFMAPEEYSTQIIASLAIGGRSPLASAIDFTQSGTPVTIAGTRFMNQKAFSMDNGTFPVVVYGAAGESVTVTFSYTDVAANLPGSTDLDVGSIILGLSVPISTLDRIFDYLKVV